MWAKRGECKNFPGFMAQTCRKACGKCNVMEEVVDWVAATDAKLPTDEMAEMLEAMEGNLKQAAAPAQGAEADVAISTGGAQDKVDVKAEGTKALAAAVIKSSSASSASAAKVTEADTTEAVTAKQQAAGADAVKQGAVSAAATIVGTKTNTGTQQQQTQQQAQQRAQQQPTVEQQQGSDVNSPPPLEVSHAPLESSHTGSNVASGAKVVVQHRDGQRSRRDAGGVATPAQHHNNQIAEVRRMGEGRRSREHAREQHQVIRLEQLPTGTSALVAVESPAPASTKSAKRVVSQERQASTAAELDGGLDGLEGPSSWGQVVLVGAAVLAALGLVSKYNKWQPKHSNCHVQ